jgi:hypothetical protein
MRDNASFADIVLQCRQLKTFRVLSAKYAHLYLSSAQELQAEINQDVMSAMESIEADDSFRHGKVRTAWEKEMTGAKHSAERLGPLHNVFGLMEQSHPDDVFIKAEERRREITEQQRKAKRHSKKTKNAGAKK